MQTLEFVKKSTSKNNSRCLASNIQKNAQVEELKNRRKDRIEALISSRRMFRLENSNVFYVESSQSSIFHYCKMNFTEFEFCSCKGFTFRKTCSHLEMILMGIKRNVIVDVQKLPSFVKKDNEICNVDVLPYTQESYSF